MATTIGFADLKSMIQVYLSEWSTMTVKDEALFPVGPLGDVFMSFWDNWALPPDPYGIDPMLIKDGFVLVEGTDYAVTQHGDGVRGKITLTNPEGPDVQILATYRRTLWRDTFWGANIQHAINEISGRLLMANVGWVDDPTTITLDAINDPWPIVVKQAGKNALANLQTFLAGLGKTQLEGVSMDLSRAHNMVHEIIDDLEQDIDRDVVAWRWRRAPAGRQSQMVAALTPINGPWGGRLY